MTVFQALFKNHLLVSAFLGWTAAQVFKAILYLISKKEFKLDRLLGSGGMPSSHSAAVSALATKTGIQYGLESYQFAFAAILAIIVMYDACGVRRAAGEHAKLLNILRNTVFENKPTDEKLKELIGHTPLQVIAGVIIGILVAVFI